MPGDLFNKDFEWGLQTPGPNGYNEYSAPDDTSVPGWLLTSGGVVHFRDNFVPNSGSWSLGLGNTAHDTGRIEQARENRGRF